MSKQAEIRGPDTSEWASPEDYNRFIRGLELQSLRMASGEFSADPLPTIEDPVETDITFEARFEAFDGGFVAFHRLRLLGSPRGTSEEESVEIVAEYAVTYQSDVDINRSLFLPFMHLNLPVQTWPYFREFVQSSIGRLDWPRLILPVLHSQGTSVNLSEPIFDMDRPASEAQDA